MANFSVPIINKDPYTNDFGEGLEALSVNAVTKRPNWLSPEAFEEILALFGFRSKTSQDVFPCETNTFTPRRLEFVSTEGSFSIPIQSLVKQNTIDGITKVKSAVNTNTRKLLCVKKIGEKHSDVYDLRNKSGVPTPGTHAVSSGPGSRFAGKFFYTNDIGVAQLLNFAIDTELKGSPPAILEGLWGTCVGGKQSVLCTSPVALKARHFVLTTLYGENENITGSQTHKIPFATDTVGAKVKECGVALANLTSAVCLTYEGEGDAKYHKTLGVSLR